MSPLPVPANDYYWLVLSIWIVVEVNGKKNNFPYVVDINTASSLKSGDLLVTFNDTPALWIVKAYVGMRNQIEAKEGDAVMERAQILATRSRTVREHAGLILKHRKGSN